MTYNYVYIPAPAMQESAYAGPSGYSQEDSPPYPSNYHLDQGLQPAIDGNAANFVPPFLYLGHEPYVSRTLSLPMDMAANMYAPATCVHTSPTSEDLWMADPQIMPQFDYAYSEAFPSYDNTGIVNVEQSAPLGAATLYQSSDRPLSSDLSRPSCIGHSTQLCHHASVAASPTASTSSPHLPATFSDGTDSDNWSSPFPDNDEGSNNSTSFLPSGFPLYDDVRQTVAVQDTADAARAYFEGLAAEEPTTACRPSIAAPAAPGPSQTSVGAPQVPQPASRPPTFPPEEPVLGPHDPLRIRADGMVQCNLHGCKHACKNKSDLRRHRQKLVHIKRQFPCRRGCGTLFTRLDGEKRHYLNRTCLKPTFKRRTGEGIQKRTARGGNGRVKKKGISDAEGLYTSFLS